MTDPTDIPELHSVETLNASSGPGWNQSIDRLRVPGGWLYVSQVSSTRGVAIHQTFVKD